MSWTTAYDLASRIWHTAAARFSMPVTPRLSGCRFTPYTTAWKKFATVIKRLRAYDARALSPTAYS
eukprot:15415744-Alexandrium_andersonii.AAC.1